MAAFGTREIEFEFAEDSGGEFRPSGNVVEVVFDHVRRGETERAASLLAASGADVGDRLVREAEIGASQELWRRLAALFAAARDVGRAAKCAEAIGDHGLAAGFYEAAYDWQRAAEQYQRAGRSGKAAEMYERSLAFDKAAALYLEAGEHLRAAECYARAGAYYHAGHLYMRLGRYEKGVEVLQRVDRMQKWFAESSALLGRFFERTGNAEIAMAHYADVVRSRPVDATTLEVHHRLALLLAGSGRVDQANRLWGGVLGVDPRHPGATEGMKLLGAGGVAQGAGDAVRLLVLPGEEGAVRAAPSAPRREVAAVRVDFEVLRQLPMFGELTLEELQSMHTLADRVAFAKGDVLIEQGRTGEALFILASGRVKVEVLAEGKPPRQVAALGTGAALGEMAMVDEAPTSARVTAIEDGNAFRFRLDRLVTHLATEPRAGFKVMRYLGRILSVRLREANRAVVG
ncbi:MAG: cyclic nucleotide-binding domain-containing protein [Proteobacteria bacterium]|jgi:tetratricopeptide (TPR) repeat protein|nr:cyclic nucleotide-binding domain-containing protein [Pseudomonadota bacterium]